MKIVHDISPDAVCARIDSLFEGKSVAKALTPIRQMHESRPPEGAALTIRSGAQLGYAMAGTFKLGMDLDGARQRAGLSISFAKPGT